MFSASNALSIRDAFAFEQFVCGGDDATFYWKTPSPRAIKSRVPEDLRDYLRRVQAVHASLKKGESPTVSFDALDQYISVCHPFDAAKVHKVRANLGLCYQGKFVSGSLRGATFAPSQSLRNERSSIEPAPLDAWTPGPDVAGACLQNYDLAALILDLLQPSPAALATGHEDASATEQREVSVAPPSTLSIARNSFKRPGLIVISGSTNSGKSELARSLALEILRRAIQVGDRSGTIGDREGVSGDSHGNPSSPEPKTKKAHYYDGRLPHLVTFEDPIEQWDIGVRAQTGLLERMPVTKRKGSDFTVASLLEPYCTPSKKTPDMLPCAALGFCFTPRQKGIDVASLEDALRDAKRQTPSCVYVGEVRRPTDWRHILEFAGSGHLVITTTHASSLTETIARILRATRAANPTDRSAVGGQLLACVHAGLFPIGFGKKAQLPSIWVRSGASLTSLIANGLSGVVADGDNVLSRHQFVNEFFGTGCVCGPLTQEQANSVKVARKQDVLELSRQ